MTIKFAIQIEFDVGEWVYITENESGKVVLYATYNEALAESKIWNQPRVVSYSD